MILGRRSDACLPMTDDQKGFGKNHVDYIEEHLTPVYVHRSSKRPVLIPRLSLALKW
jgi:hypothetical protein